MAPHLPDDVLYLISTQLFLQQEFNTLFNCSLASRALAVPALRNLYRMQEAAPIRGDETQSLAKDSIARWAKLWRSLLLSSLDKTAYPYCHYIRVLDLNDLGLLLQESWFRNEYSNTFFTGDLARFLVEHDSSAETRSQKYRRFNDSMMLQMIGDSISARAPMVEELITGNHLSEISEESLIQWIPRMRQLRRLQLIDGLKATNIGIPLKENCPYFGTLKFYTAAPGADDAISDLLDTLNPNTLQSLGIFSHAPIDERVFSSLNNHAQTLTELKLGDLNGSSVPRLSNLKKCRSVQSLSFTVRGYDPDPKEMELHLPEIVEWLQSCKDLRILTIENFSTSVQLLTPMLLHPAVKLTSLTVRNYDSALAADFHKALPHQASSLRTLVLEAEGETCDQELLLSSLCELSALVEIRLQGVSDYFHDRHIISLAKCLPSLEDFWVTGFGITDAILNAIGSLSSLRRLEILALSSFTLDGILDFITHLGPGNHGLNLSIMMADPTSELSEYEQSIIREGIMAKVEGRFDYQLSRDPNAADSTDSDSD